LVPGAKNSYPSKGLAALAVLALLLPGSLVAQRDTVPAPRPRVVMALAQTLALNTLVNRLDVWARDKEWARVSTRTWAHNIRHGWAWDEDAFETNVFAHPYHGSLYFNAARANGVDFFTSIPITLFGAWTWEYFGETERPSLNDFLLTGLGGVTLGEMFHRGATTIRDNTDVGFKRAMRELVAVPVDPMGSLNRLFRGGWSRVGPNPAAHDPDAYVLRFGAGARFARDFMNDSVASVGAIQLDVLYGDAFAGRYEMPFDVFSLRVLVSTYTGLTTFQASGQLYGRNLNDSTARIRHTLAVNQRYDFQRNPAQKFGGQSLEVGINSRWRFGDRDRGAFALRTALFLDGIILGAIDAPGAGMGQRDYDFGSGGGIRWEAGLERHAVRFLTLHGRIDYMHTVSGAAADHMVNTSGVELYVPVGRRLGVTAQTYLFDRESHYINRPPDRRDFPEARLMAVWTRAASKP